MIQFGGKELKSPYGAFLCVGLAYFLIAILLPLGLFMAGEKKPDLRISGITFATLAGVAGALGALCVIFAVRSASRAEDKLYIAPIIFALAPILNTIISLFWHPSSASPFQFGLPQNPPSWKLYIGIVLAGLGAALVLYSKEEAEASHPPATTQRTSTKSLSQNEDRPLES
jgi:drug/metabolite transporter (DMT)-like permease